MGIAAVAMTAAEITNADGAGQIREYAGLSVVIDRPKGTVIRGRLADGTQWERKWSVDYGYFPRTDGGDGQGLDVFLGPNPKSRRVFWTTHKNPDGSFQQLKTFIGFESPEDALALYEASYPDDLRGGPMRETSVALLSALLGRKPEEIMAKLQEGPTLFDLSPADVHTPSAPATGAARARKVATGPAKAAKKKRGVLGRKIHVRADIAPGGRLSVRHMHLFDGGTATLVTMSDSTHALRDIRPIRQGEEIDPKAVDVTLVGPDAWFDGTPKKLVWVQLAEVGSWKGHPAGAFDMTPSTFADIVRNFGARGLPVPFDFEHASEQDSTQGSIPQKGSPAPGWVHRLDNRSIGGLWGLVEWLDVGRDLIKSGGYAFLSPAIRFASRDGKSGSPIGARLTSVALTNQPFLSGLDMLRAAKDTSGAASATLSRIKAALGVHSLASAEETRECLVQLRDACAQSEDGTHDGVLLDDYLQPLVTIAGLAPSVAVSDLLDAVDTMIDAAMAQHVADAHDGDQTSANAINKAAWRARARVETPTRAAMADREPEKDTVMNEAEAVALRDAQKKAVDLDVALKDANGKAEKAEITLKDVSARAETAEKLITEITVAVTLKDGETLFGAVKRLSDENAKLLDDKIKRDEADLVADVDRTITHYKLKSEQKPTLLRLARGDRAAFNDLYPPLTDAEARLLSEVTPPAPRDAVGGAPEGLSFTGTVAKVIEEAQKAGKPITLADAQNEAVRRMKQPV